MTPGDPPHATTRRDLFTLIGRAAGSAMMYQAMTSLGHAAESNYRGPLRLDGDPKGASVVVLGAGLAGMVAAYELRRAGYKVQVLEYSDRAGGRCWTVRGGDRYTELGGFTQHCAFDRGLYINPGPWRIPYHHRALLDYCKRFHVALEPFIQVNYNAYLHSAKAFGGKPQRYRADPGRLPRPHRRTAGEGNRPGQARRCRHGRGQGACCSMRCARGARSMPITPIAPAIDASDRRGYDVDAGGGIGGAPVPSTPLQARATCSIRACGRASSPATATNSRPPCSSPRAAWT